MSHDPGSKKCPLNESDWPHWWAPHCCCPSPETEIDPAYRREGGLCDSDFGENGDRVHLHSICTIERHSERIRKLEECLASMNRTIGYLMKLQGIEV